MMWTLISVSLALVINFYSPEIPKNKKSIRNNYPKNKIITSFPYQYFEGEVLTDEMVEFRIRLIYISFMIFITVTFSVSPIVGQATFSSTPTSVERLSSKQLDYQTNQQELLLDLRGGGSDLSAFIIRILLLLTMAQNPKPTDGFQPKPRIHQHFGRQEHVQPNPRIASKLQENPVDKNNPGQGSCRSSNHLYMDKFANSRSPNSKININKEHQNFVAKMKTKGHFVDDIDCDLERFGKLSTNPETDFIDRKSINEAKTILQSEKENIVINARQPNLNKGEPNLDFAVDGPGSYNYVDVKNPIDPGRFPPAKKKPESFNKMAKRIGEKITKQKGGSDKVLHIVDLEQIPSEVKENITKKIIEGAGSPKDIKFIN